MSLCGLNASASGSATYSTEKTLLAANVGNAGICVGGIEREKSKSDAALRNSRREAGVVLAG